MQKVISRMSVLSKITAEAKFVRISPTKVRRVAKLVRGKDVDEALNLLKRLPHKGARLLYSVMKSAKANAENNNKILSGLVVSEILINEGPRIKRFQPRARGRMCQIIKRTSHIFVGLNNLKGATNGK
jgi:large subunit ribosomal protein L22